MQMATGGLQNKRVREIFWIALSVVGSIFIFMLLEAFHETKWTIYILASLIFVVMLLVSGNVKKSLFILFVIGLQMKVSLFLGDPSQFVPRWVGSSGPTGIEISFVTIPAAFLLIHHWFTHIGSDQWRFFWGKEITYPAALVFLTTAVTILYTSERRLVIYYLIHLLELYIVFLAVINIIRSRDDVVLVIKLLMITLAIQSVIYFIQNITGVTFDLLGEVIVHKGETLQRHGGTVSSNVKGFANFITPLLLIAVSRFLSTTNRRVKGWLCLLCAMGTAALVLTFTRASWVGFILGMVLIVTLGMIRGIIHPRRLIPFVGVAVIVVIILLPKIMIRLSEDQKAAYDERYALMRMAWNVIETHPLLGVGAGAYGYVFRRYLPYDLEDKWLYIVHNVYLLRWAETGVIGLVSFLILLIAGLRQAFVCSRVRDEVMSSLALGWGAGLMSLIWEMYWDTALGPQTQFVLWFMFGLILVVKRMGLHSSSSNRVGIAMSSLVPVQ
jgi:hypothetical protein